MPMRAVRPQQLAFVMALVACGPALRQQPAGGLPAPKAGPVPTAPQLPSAEDGSTRPVQVALPESLEVRLHGAMAHARSAVGLTDSVLFAGQPAVIADSAAGSVDEEVSWDIDVMSYVTHDRVSRYVSLFTGPAKGRIEARLQRGKRYEPMIREKFRARGIPEDMYYLGLVESGYDPHAYSRAAAVGMWQFMSSTARGMGLRVDQWVDERRDPIKATDAAARFLNMLQKQFGSYYLAAAAYNGGPGRVSRGLARFQDELQESVGDDRFFTLAEQSYLRSETRNYVPQLIAAALVGKTPERYGLTVSDSVAAFAYDSVRVPELTSLGTIAMASNSSVDEIRDLNPHFLRGATPPRFSAFVRVPTGKAAGFDSSYLALPDEDRIGFTYVRSAKGQTLASVARAHGLDARRLGWYNPGLSASRKLPVGKRIMVPATHVVASARDVPDPRIERYGSSRRAGRTVHVVRRGESLGSIARRYRTSVASLQRVNGLKRTVVYPGQTIIVRASGSARPRSAAKRPAAKAKSPQVSTTTSGGSKTKPAAR